MQVLYKSTRGKEETVTASMAILKGLSEDGGLFVPTEIPKLDVPMDELAKMSYQETAYEVMKCFLTDFTEEELKNCINNAYDEKFDTKDFCSGAKTASFVLAIAYAVLFVSIVVTVCTIDRLSGAK